MTSPLAVGEFRLRRQAAGRGAFAHVRVEVHVTERNTPQVTWAVDPADSASAHPDRDQAEVDAALAGAERAVTELSRLGVATSSREVRVTFLGINLVDTEPTAVAAASAAATASAFGEADSFEVVYVDGWHCRTVR